MASPLLHAIELDFRKLSSTTTTSLPQLVIINSNLENIRRYGQHKKKLLAKNKAIIKLVVSSPASVQ